MSNPGTAAPPAAATAASKPKPELHYAPWKQKLTMGQSRAMKVLSVENWFMRRQREVEADAFRLMAVFFRSPFLLQAAAQAPCLLSSCLLNLLLSSPTDERSLSGMIIRTWHDHRRLPEITQHDHPDLRLAPVTHMTGGPVTRIGTQ